MRDNNGISKNKKNRPRKPPRKPLSFGFIFSVFRIMSLVGLVFAIATGFIFCHDVILQLSFLKIKDIELNGLSRISKTDILEKTGMKTGRNIMTVNFSAARKLIEAEPWVESVEIRTELPNRVIINIREREAIALIYLGEFYVVDSRGMVFKKYGEGDPEELPVITGLAYQDTVNENAAGNEMWHSILEILTRKDGVIPASLIKSVSVDYQMGLGLTLRNGPLVKLGTGAYNLKYERLAVLMHQKDRPFDYSQIETIDLQNIDRIIVGFKIAKPAGTEAEGKEA